MIRSICPHGVDVSPQMEVATKENDYVYRYGRAICPECEAAAHKQAAMFREVEKSMVTTWQGRNVEELPRDELIAAVKCLGKMAGVYR